MLLLLFGNASSGPAPTPPSGLAGASRRIWTRIEPEVLPNDDLEALKLLLDAEDADIVTAVTRYDKALRRLLH